MFSHFSCLPYFPMNINQLTLLATMSANTSPVSQRKRSITPAPSPGGLAKKPRFEEEGAVEAFQNRLSELINKLNEDRETDQATMSGKLCFIISAFP